MFVNFDPDRFWDEPAACKSCKGPILSSHTTEKVEVPFDGQHKLHELNGVYHSECAKPFLSLMHAMTVLSRGFQ